MILRVLRSRQMSSTLTIRLPADLAKWLAEASKKSGVARATIVRQELERARHNSGKAKPWAHVVGALKDGPRDLSMRKGFSRK